MLKVYDLDDTELIHFPSYVKEFVYFADVMGDVAVAAVAVVVR